MKLRFNNCIEIACKQDNMSYYLVSEIVQFNIYELRSLQVNLLIIFISSTNL